MFGICSKVPQISSNSVHSILNEKFSYLVGGGRNDRTYWFLAVHMGKTFYGADIPKFTKEDEQKIIERHWNDYITPDLRFSDLYRRSHFSFYTPLQEQVYKMWYFERMLTIGDASHKVSIKLPSREK